MPLLLNGPLTQGNSASSLSRNSLTSDPPELGPVPSGNRAPAEDVASARLSRLKLSPHIFLPLSSYAEETLGRGEVFQYHFRKKFLGAFEEFG